MRALFGELVPKAALPMILGIGIFSFFGNLLLLTGPLYMLQIYERVLATRSVETLIGLTLIAMFLLLMWGVLDFSRGRVLARLGTEFRAGFDRKIGMISENQGDRFQGVSRAKLIALAESIERIAALPLGAAIADVIWTPIFLVGLALFHPGLCGLACLGILGLIVLHRLGQMFARPVAARAQMHGANSADIACQIEAEDGGAQRHMHHRNLWRHWADIRLHERCDFAAGSDIKGIFEAAQRTWKLCLQSAMLGLGAFLVLRADLSAGAMVAATILLARALGPVEVLAAHWPILVEARHNWRALNRAFEGNPTQPEIPAMQNRYTQLHIPALNLALRQDKAKPMPGFDLQAGEVLSVIGAPGSGKSAFLRAIQSGGDDSTCRLGEDRCLLPARPSVFSGSIAQNITGFSETADGKRLNEAARDAGLYRAIAQLPKGVATEVDDIRDGWDEASLYRLGLAQALYDPPPVLLLEDPFAAQPPEGAEAIAAILETRSKARRITIFTAQHPAALDRVHKLLWLDQGQCRGIGPRDSVLARFLAPWATQDLAVQLDLAS